MAIPTSEWENFVLEISTSLQSEKLKTRSGIPLRPRVDAVLPDVVLAGLLERGAEPPILQSDDLPVLHHRPAFLVHGARPLLRVVHLVADQALHHSGPVVSFVFSAASSLNHSDHMGIITLGGEQLNKDQPATSSCHDGM